MLLVRSVQSSAFTYFEASACSTGKATLHHASSSMMLSVAPKSLVLLALGIGAVAALAAQGAGHTAGGTLPAPQPSGIVPYTDDQEHSRLDVDTAVFGRRQSEAASQSADSPARSSLLPTVIKTDRASSSSSMSKALPGIIVPPSMVIASSQAVSSFASVSSSAQAQGDKASSSFASSAAGRSSIGSSVSSSEGASVASSSAQPVDIAPAVSSAASSSPDAAEALLREIIGTVKQPSRHEIREWKKDNDDLRAIQGGGIDQYLREIVGDAMKKEKGRRGIDD